MLRFNFVQTSLAGLVLVQRKAIEDDRGFLSRFYCADEFRSAGLDKPIAQINHTLTSKKGAVRGLHFQNPPQGHSKLVYCTSGMVLDVVLDLRVGSPSYLKYVSLELSAGAGNMLYLPEGLAHGFYAVTEATVAYNVSTVYVPELDDGVLWNSFGMSWPDISPVISERDSGFDALADFQSPFKFS